MFNQYFSGIILLHLDYQIRDTNLISLSFDKDYDCSIAGNYNLFFLLNFSMREDLLEKSSFTKNLKIIAIGCD